jgi:hypothetical protein
MATDMELLILGGFYFAIVGGFGAYVAVQKNRAGAEGLLLGLLFGPLGVLVEACLPTVPPPAPPAPPSPPAIALMRQQDAAYQKAAVARLFVEEKAAAALDAFRRQREIEISEEKGRIAAEKAERLAERDNAYRAMGIEPGPWAWFQAMSDLKQAVMIGLVIAIPVGGMMVLIFRILKPFSAP